MNRSRHRPYWLPASTFYFLAAAVAMGVFFIVWAILAETKEENPWITAGLLSSVSLISAVVVREVILRHRRNAVYSKQRKLDRAVMSAPVLHRSEQRRKKLTLDRNAFLVNEIVRKSEAATILGSLAESHREVFELCERYIEVATSELATVGVGSPRLAAITRGREKAERLHKHHMLRWAEIEVRTNTLAASESDRLSVSLDRARTALKALHEVYEHYPEEPAIVDSRIAVERYILSTRIKGAFERAERAENRGDVRKAIESMYEADRLLRKVVGDDSDLDLVPRVRSEIERLENLT